jgi:hypothetical protein
VVVLGKIENMPPGYMVVAKKDGTVVFGYHHETFRKTYNI